MINVMKVPRDLGITTIAGDESGHLSGCKKKSSRLGIRHLQFLMLFFGLSAAYSMRVNLSVAIVAMTDSEGANPNFPEYNWDERTKSLLLSSFFWGYIITQVPSGELARRFGGRLTILVGTFICSLLNILTPVFTNIGNWKLLVALRIVEGFCQGVIFPSTHTIISQWACVEERGLFTIVTYSGSQFGTFVMLGVSGILSTSVMGWPSIFYFSGSSGLVFCLIYFFFGASRPNESKLISSEELKKIESSQISVSKAVSTLPKNVMKVPWKQILTSPAFFVLLLSHSCHNWGFWTLLTEIPSYLKSVLHKDIKSNALLSALPYFSQFILCFVFAGINEILFKHKCLTLNVSRKLFNTIGLWVPMLSLIGLGFVDESQGDLAIALLTLSVGINAADYLGFQTNHIDLSPNFAGILMGITNCVANIMSILAPLLVGFVVTDSTDPGQWRIVFYIAASLYFIGNLLFIIFGRTNVQNWNHPETYNLKNDTNYDSKNGP